MYKQYSIAPGAVFAFGVAGMAGSAMAKVEGDTIILGSALSPTGKYSTNGFHTQKGMTLPSIGRNFMGGVKVAVNHTNLPSLTTTMITPHAHLS